MGANWAVDQTITATGSIAATRVADATPIVSTALDTRTLAPGVRLLLVLSAFETNVANTGGTWTVTESATSGGSYTACTTHGTLAATPAAAGNSVQYVSVLPNGAKPWIKVTYTGADANTEVDITATLLLVPRAV